MSDHDTDVRPPWLVVYSLLLLAWGLALLGLLYWTWRTAEDARSTTGTTSNVNAIEVSLLGWHFSATSETALLLLVVATAGVGSYVHAATSFVSYVGNQRLRKSWLHWYAFRSVIGASLAVVFYVVIRAGFLNGTTSAQDVNLFGVAALAGLSGMFSKQATDKLREVFDTLFSNRVDEDRADKLDPLRIDRLDPATISAGTGPVQLEIYGSGFSRGVLVFVDGNPRPPISVEPDRLSVELSAEDLATERSIAVLVRNPSGQASQPFGLIVTPSE